MNFSELFFNPRGFFLDILYRVPGILIAFTVHEFSHAGVAVLLGDDTPRRDGRLTLNPFAHVDWVGALMLLLFGFGWAKPVTVTPGNFKKPRRDDLLVSLAGPVSNLLLAFLLFPIIAYVHIPTVSPFLNTAYTINVSLFILNMIPVPPLDGYHVVKSLFARKHLKFFWNVERFGFMLLILLSFLGVLGMVIGFGMTYITAFFSFIFLR